MFKDNVVVIVITGIIITGVMVTLFVIRMMILVEKTIRIII